MDINATNRRIGELVSAIGKNKLKPRPDFQRRLVWSDKEKTEFIKTILDGLPFPEIFIATGEVDTKTGESIEWIVDGQQRITTIYEYFIDSDNFKIGKGIQSYNSLEESNKKDFLNYSVVVRDLGNADLEEIKDIFSKINATSYDLNAMEVNNAFYNGPLKKLADQIAGSEFFDNHKVFTNSDVKRMKDTLYILNIIITCMSDYYTSDSKVEEYLDRYNNSFQKREELEKEVIFILETIENMDFDSKSRVWKKADFFTLVVELHRGLCRNSYEVNSKALKTLKAFYEEVNEAGKIVRGKKEHNTDKLGIAGEYYDAAAQGTTSKQNRTKRGKIVGEILFDSV